SSDFDLDPELDRARRRDPVERRRPGLVPAHPCEEPFAPAGHAARPGRGDGGVAAEDVADGEGIDLLAVEDETAETLRHVRLLHESPPEEDPEDALPDGLDAPALLLGNARDVCRL